MHAPLEIDIPAVLLLFGRLSDLRVFTTASHIILRRVYSRKCTSWGWEVLAGKGDLSVSVHLSRALDTYVASSAVLVAVEDMTAMLGSLSCLV